MTEKKQAKQSTKNDVKDQFLMCFLTHAPFDGWGQKTMDQAADDLALQTADVNALFPNGVDDIMKAYNQWVDDEMVKAVHLNPDFDSLKVREKIFILVKTRFLILSQHKEAVRKAASFFINPKHIHTAHCGVWQSASTMWYEAGDTSTDHNHYTKRMLLSGVIKTTGLYWLNDTSEDHTKTWDFLQNRIDNVLKIGGHIHKAKQGLHKISDVLTSFLPGNRSSSAD